MEFLLLGVSQSKQNKRHRQSLVWGEPATQSQAALDKGFKCTASPSGGINTLRHIGYINVQKRGGKELRKEIWLFRGNQHLCK